VVSQSKQPAMNVRDDDIEKRVKSALDKDAGLKSSNIELKSVNNGVVLIAGRATSMSDHLRAVQIARGVSGVRRVASEVETPARLTDRELRGDMTSAPARDDASARPDRSARADASDKRAGQMLSDSWITTSTKLRLFANETTPALDINVDTDGGVVTLFGVVSSEEAKKAAQIEASEVAGVTSVVNLLQVVPEQVQKAVAAGDADVEKAIASVLDDRDVLKDVKVEVKNGVARLTGTVSDSTDRLQASVVARSTPGVRSVQNDLRVSSR
jgi:osmotically-inducible protein OsmY